MKDYYKIGEISKIYGIGRDSLMYYEDIGILKPFRDKNGYRMYKLSDIWRLNLIKELRSLNFPMKKIKEYLELNANITKDEEFDFLIQKLQKDYENRFTILGNNNIGSSFCLDKIKQGIYNEFKSVFCFLEDEEEIYNIIFNEGYYLTLTYKGKYKNNKHYINKMFKYIE